MSRYTEFEKAAVQRAKEAADGRLSTFGLIGLLRKTVVADVKGALRRAAIARELGELDVRTLADIGVDPHGIDVLAQQIVAAETPKLPTTLEVLREIFVERPRLWAERRRARDELMSLDERLLRDIGVNRGEIDQVIYGTAEAAPVVATGEPEDVVQIIRQWNRSRAAAKTLHALDDRTLDDIGFVRGDIDWVSNELASRSVHTTHAHAA
jgi:uncharacterized protein YjiS (DUF1127 family)